MEQVASVVLSVASVAAGSFANSVLAGLFLWFVAEVCLRLLPPMRPANKFVVWGALLAATIGFYFIPGIHGGALGNMSFARNNVVQLDPRWSLLIAAIWGGMTVVRSVRVLQSAIQVYGVARRSTPVAAASFDHLLRQGARKIALCTSEEVDRPSVFGFFRPRILIPAGIYGRISDCELEQIIVHEVGHIRRYDDWSNLLQKISLALFPLNPAIAWIERRLCIERELACDDCVLMTTFSRKQYAFCLTNLAEYSMIRRNLTLALGAWGKRSELAQRVERILNRPKYSMGRKAGYALTTAVIVGLLTGGAMLSRIPGVISFTGATVTTASMPLPNITGGQPAPIAGEPSVSSVLVKSAMLQPQRSIAGIKRVRRNTSRSIRGDRLAEPVPGVMVMRSEFDENYSLPRLIFTDQNAGPAYAAMPMGNGWLVIQL